jgi:hypothetical protein
MPLAGKMSFHILLLGFQMRDGMIALDNACGETSNRATPVWYSFSLEYANRQIAFCNSFAGFVGVGRRLVLHWVPMSR